MKATRNAADRTLIDIGEVIQNGVAFDFKNWRGGTVDAEHIPEAVARLFALLEKKRIDVVLVRGVALLQYAKGRELKPHVSESDLGEIREIMTDLRQRIARIERGLNHT